MPCIFAGKVEQLEIDLAKSKASEEEIRFKYREADIKLNALQDYFKNMESDLHRYIITGVRKTETDVICTKSKIVGFLQVLWFSPKGS